MLGSAVLTTEMSRTTRICAVSATARTAQDRRGPVSSGSPRPACGSECAAVCAVVCGAVCWRLGAVWLDMGGLLPGGLRCAPHAGPTGRRSPRSNGRDLPGGAGIRWVGTVSTGPSKGRLLPSSCFSNNLPFAAVVAAVSPGRPSRRSPPSFRGGYTATRSRPNPYLELPRGEFLDLPASATRLL